MKILPCFLIVVLLAGCASDPSQPPKPKPVAKPRDPTEGWIRGSLTRLDKARVLEFRIEKKFAWGGSASGGVAAIDATSGEKFRGTYTAMLQSSRGGFQAFGSSGRSVHGTVYQTSRNANGAAVLTGDKGTVISLQMEIMAGWSPHGIGWGQDNAGTQYQMQF